MMGGARPFVDLVNGQVSFSDLIDLKSNLPILVDHTSGVGIL